MSHVQFTIWYWNRYSDNPMSFLSDKEDLEKDLGKNMVLIILRVLLDSKLFTSPKEQWNVDHLDMKFFWMWLLPLSNVIVTSVDGLS